MTRNQARTTLSEINWTLIGSNDGEIAICPKGARGLSRDKLTYYTTDYDDAVGTAKAENAHSVELFRALEARIAAANRNLAA